VRAVEPPELLGAAGFVVPVVPAPVAPLAPLPGAVAPPAGAVVVGVAGAPVAGAVAVEVCVGAVGVAGGDVAPPVALCVGSPARGLLRPAAGRE